MKLTRKLNRSLRALNDSSMLINSKDRKFAELEAQASQSGFEINEPEFMKEIMALPYYHGYITRRDSEDLITEIGDFLVRRTQKDWGELDCMIAISVRVENDPIINAVENIVIPRNYTKNAWDVCERIQCRNLARYITKCHQRRRKFVINDREIRFLHPIVRHGWLVSHDIVHPLEELGRGAYGVVYKGFIDIDDNRKLMCAIKTLTQDTLLRKNTRESLVYEAHINRKLEHRNIVKFRALAIDSDPIMVVMELCTNGTLGFYLRDQCYRMPIRERVRMAMEVAQGLRYLEKNGVVHGDLASRNILLDSQLTIKISDFGLATKMDLYKHKVEHTRNYLNDFSRSFPVNNNPELDTSQYGFLLNEMFFDFAKEQAPSYSAFFVSPSNMPSKLAKLARYLLNMNIRQEISFQTIVYELCREYAQYQPPALKKYLVDPNASMESNDSMHILSLFSPTPMSGNSLEYSSDSCDFGFECDTN